jgi:hypothetical protein
MKLIIPISIILLLPMSCNAQAWKFVTKSNSGTNWYFRESTATNSNYKKAWTKNIPTKLIFTNRKGKLVTAKNGFCVDLQLYDCAAMKTKTQSIAYYDAKGSVLEIVTFNDLESEWLDVLPDSIGETIFNKICNN